MGNLMRGGASRRGAAAEPTCKPWTLAPFIRFASQAGVPWEPGWDKAGIRPSEPDRDEDLPIRGAYRFVHDLSYRHGARSLGSLAPLGTEVGLALNPRMRDAVIRAPSLLDALVGAREWTHLQAPKSWIGLRLTARELLVLHCGSGGPELPGADSIEEYRTLRIIDLVRRYAGAAWLPPWIGLMQKGPVDPLFADSSGAARITTGERFSVVAINRSVFSHGGFGSLAPDSASTPGSAPESEGDWSGWIRMLQAVLPTEAALGSPSAESAAEMLGWSVRTLQRRLREEGTTYRRLLLETRHREARRLLLATEAPVHVIAERVGYTDPANFARAFRGHWGLSPQSLRDLEGPSPREGAPRP